MDTNDASRIKRLETAKKWRIKNREKIRAKARLAYDLADKDKLREYRRKRRVANVEKISAQERACHVRRRQKALIQQAKYYQEHKQERDEYCKKWREENYDSVIECQRKSYHKNKHTRLPKEYSRRKVRYANDPTYRLVHNLRDRLRAALKAQSVPKSRKTLELLGCDPLVAREYIETRFAEDMSWSNHGILWEVDHVRPCSSFDLTDEEQQKQCFHYTNLQPLYKADNRSKSAMWIPTPNG